MELLYYILVIVMATFVAWFMIVQHRTVDRLRHNISDLRDNLSKADLESSKLRQVIRIKETEYRAAEKSTLLRVKHFMDRLETMVSFEAWLNSVIENGLDSESNMTTTVVDLEIANDVLVANFQQIHIIPEKIKPGDIQTADGFRSDSKKED